MKEFSASEGVILLLDSNSVMRSALSDALQNAGYLVVAADGLGAAVDRIHEIKPDLLITRPFINNMPGHTAANYLRSKRPGLPVLIVAGFMDDDRIKVQNAVEEFHTFPKPFSRDDLVAKVREVLQVCRKGRSADGHG
jgi:DNA-binding NtrC family response regulator